MKNRWRRWRTFFDRVEELMRLTGEGLEREREDLAESVDAGRLSTGTRDRELARRALSVPFFRELLGAALEAGPEGLAEPQDREFLGAWGADETASRASAAGAASAPDRGHDISGPDDAHRRRVPLRLRTAERVLAERTRSLTVVLDDLGNPLNASAVVRSCEALGLQELHFCHRHGRIALSHGIHKECHRWIDLHWYRSPESAARHLRARGFSLLAADLAPGAVDLEDIPLAPPVALVFGNEQTGVSPEFRELVDGVFRLPTVGFTSYINVSNAVALSVASLDHRLREAGLRASLDDEDKARLRKSWYAALARTPERRREFLSYLERPPRPLEEHESRRERHGGT